jgi:hypothetical protein
MSIRLHLYWDILNGVLQLLLLGPCLVDLLDVCIHLRLAIAVLGLKGDFLYLRDGVHIRLRRLLLEGWKTLIEADEPLLEE